MGKIGELFALDVARQIEEVIKVDQTDEQLVFDELNEYIVTDSIRHNVIEILDRYAETPNKPHEGIGVWVSGFFGAGKSSFAKYLGLALENRSIAGTKAAELLANRAGDLKTKVLLQKITEHIPTNAVSFDLATDRSVRTGDQSIIEIIYKAILRTFGYAGDLDLSELEMSLEEARQLDRFKDKYREVFNREWDVEKGKVALAIQQASRVMHELDPNTYPTADSWREAAIQRADINAGRLAERALVIVERRGTGPNLVVVIDEVGQFVAHNVQRMLDLQGVVQSFGRVGRGRLWLIVTSQERLNELVSGLDERRPQLARLMDRFPLQAHLEPSDIMEVTSRRVLVKNAAGEQLLRRLFETHRSRLHGNTRLAASVRYPELTAQSFIDLYPLLPYQVELMIDVVSGLRTQGGAAQHIGGANRTIIKLAQQLLIHPDIRLQDKDIGTLVRLDHIYDLVSGNIASEIRRKVDAVEQQVPHPYAARVAKAVSLLQYVPTLPATAENIAATLVPSVDADSPLTEVREALAALEEARMIREGDSGYRIPTPTEDDWEDRRRRFDPRPLDVNQIHREALEALWSPQPAHTLADVKVFRAGCYFGGRVVQQGAIPFHISLVETPELFPDEVEQARIRSQSERQAVFWVASVSESIERVTREIHRSNAILQERERNARTQAELQLVAEEKNRRQRFETELKRLLNEQLLAGRIFFRGNDRSPDDRTDNVVKAAEIGLQQVLPVVFHRFEEGAARVDGAALRAVLTEDDLRGLPKVFTDLNLLRQEDGRIVFNTGSSPLAEVLNRIENRTAYGDVASGNFLTDEFAKEPFGWDFDVVRLFVTSLLRAGVVEMRSQGQRIESAQSVEARAALENNNRFRSASFLPKKTLEMEHRIEAAENFQSTFGRDLMNLEPGAVAKEIRNELERDESEVQDALALLERDNLPGVSVLRDALLAMRQIRRLGDAETILDFNKQHASIKEGIQRAAEIIQSLTEPKLLDVRRARTTLMERWEFLQTERDLPKQVLQAAERLQDLLQKDSFFRDVPSIDELSRVLEEEYARRHTEASQARAKAYRDGLNRLRKVPGWDKLDPAQQAGIEESLVSKSEEDKGMAIPISLLRADIDACKSRVDAAIAQVIRLTDEGRVVVVSVSDHLSGHFESETELNEALERFKQQCFEHFDEGKKVVLR